MNDPENECMVKHVIVWGSLYESIHKAQLVLKCLMLKSCPYVDPILIEDVFFPKLRSTSSKTIIKGTVVLPWVGPIVLRNVIIKRTLLLNV